MTSYTFWTWEDHRGVFYSFDGKLFHASKLKAFHYARRRGTLQPA